MSASPVYAQLLDGFLKPNSYPPTSPEDANNKLDEVWYWFEQSQNHITLDRVANAALDIMALETHMSRAELLDAALVLHIEKNAGYAGADNPDTFANFRRSTAFDVPVVNGIYVRMSDKYMRISNIRRDPTNERVGEKMYESARDLFAYALIAHCIRLETPDPGLS